MLWSIGLSLPAQDFTWWNDLHDWDGATPWQQYLIVSPAFFGPNALPVPEVKTGRIDENAWLTVSAEKHSGRGDETENLHLAGFTPLFSDRVGLSLEWVSLERYRMTEATRDERRARDFDGRGWASGDVYLGTHVQLLTETTKRPSVLLTINLRTASGNRLTAARYTDAPGYFFDLSVGKNFPVGHRGVALRPYLMGGFYVWQRYETNALQNDAILYGAGVELSVGKLKITNALGGYAGYLDDGDKPLVYRFNVKTFRWSRTEYGLRLQQGLNDFSYTSLRLSCAFHFGALLNERCY